MALFVAAPVWGQGFYAGVKAGVPFTDYFETGASGSLHGGAQYFSATRRYTLGVAGEWRLKNRLRIEMDALYHRLGYTGNIQYFDSANGNYARSLIETKGNSWDFPLMAKVRLGRWLKPFATGGGVLRYIGPAHVRGTETTGSLVGGTPATITVDSAQPSDLAKRFYPGVTAGGGFEFRAGRLRVLPEFRYTRWTANISGPAGVLRFAPNQAEFLAGVLF